MEDYVGYLRTEEGFTANDYLFPSTKRGHDENDQFCRDGLTKERWANAQPMRDIFREAFKEVDMPYFNPHSFRKTLMALAYEMNLSGEEIKAWSQNLGHEKLDTSVNSYGPVSLDRQRARMLALHERHNTDDNRPATLADLKKLLVQNGIQIAMDSIHPPE